MMSPTSPPNRLGELQNQNDPSWQSDPFGSIVVNRPTSVVLDGC